MDTAGAVDKYLRERRAAREFSAATHRTAGYVLRNFATYCPDDVQRITRRHVFKWFDSQATCASSTVAARYGTIRAFLRWACATGVIGKDPSHGIAGPTRPRRNPRAVHGDDITALMATAPDSRTRLAICLFACEGLRLNEVCTLQIGDIDWRTELITVIGKGDKQRRVHLSPATAAALRSYLSEWPASCGWVIRSFHDGTSPVTPNRLGRVVTEHMASMGIKTHPRDGFSPHAFRHSYGSDLVDEGLTLPEVADLMGHSSIQTTMAYQRHVDMSRTRSAANGRSYAGAVAVMPRVAV